jgi:uncharacterized protein involved in exopolysaccharide biosynthesis
MSWRKPKNIQEWAHILLRHRKKFFFTALPVMLIVVLVSFRIPREYRTEAVFERSNPSVTQDTGNSVIRRHVNTIRRTMRENILGKAAVEQLIDDLNMTQGFPRHSDGTLTAAGEQMKADKVREIQQRMNIGFRLRDDQMDLVTVAYTSEDRLAGAEIVNKATQNYIRKTRLELDEMLGTALAFYESRVDNARALEQVQEAKLLRFRADTPGVDLDNPVALRNKIIEIEGSLTRIKTELENNKAEYASMKEFVESAEPYIETPISSVNPEYNALMQRRNNLQAERDRQRMDLGRTEEHPQVKKLDVQIADLNARLSLLEPNLEGQVHRTPNPGIFEAQSRMRVLQGEINALQARLGEQQTVLRNTQLIEDRFYQKREEYSNIERNLRDAKKELAFWEGYLQRTTIALDIELNSNGVRLVQTQFAQPLSRPTNPTLPKILGAALAAGLAVGVLMMLLSELLDHSFRSVDQAVDELKLPVLGSVAQITTPGDVLHRRIYSWAIYPAIGTTMVLVIVVALGVVYLSLEKPQQFDDLKTNPVAMIKSLAKAN